MRTLLGALSAFIGAAIFQFVLVTTMAMEVNVQSSRRAAVGGPVAIASSDGFCMLCPPEQVPFASVDPLAAAGDVLFTAILVFVLARQLGPGAAVVTTVIAILFHPLALAVGARLPIDPVLSWTIPLALGLSVALVLRELRRRREHP